MFKKNNWLSNTFMLLASIAFTGIIITVFNKEVLPYFTQEKVDEQPELRINPISIQVYKNDPRQEGTQPDVQELGSYYFEISGVEDSIVYFRSEEKDEMNAKPPCVFNMGENIVLPEDVYDKPLVLQYLFNGKLLSSFPIFTMKQISDSIIKTTADFNERKFYKSTSTDGKTLVYIVFN